MLGLIKGCQTVAPEGTSCGVYTGFKTLPGLPCLGSLLRSDTLRSLLGSLPGRDYALGIRAGVTAGGWSLKWGSHWSLLGCCWALKVLRTMQGKASADHTTLLLNCYTKLKDVDKLDRFLRGSGAPDSAPALNFDVETAVKVGGPVFAQQALHRSMQCSCTARAHVIVCSLGWVFDAAALCSLFRLCSLVRTRL